MGLTGNVTDTGKIFMVPLLRKYLKVFSKMANEVLSHTTHPFTCEDYYSVDNAKTKLTNIELWDQFHYLETEMIITKSGRRMFPSISISITDLDPDADYCLFLEINLAQRCRYKYSCTMGWTVAGHEESQSPHQMYMHPESPSKGQHWMNQEVSFSRAKLTNTISPPPGQIVLSSMHKYQPKIVLVKTSNPQAIAWAPTKLFVFPQTQFIAVTAYQNEKITKLKIDHNPFAKGFRENGKSSLKRKQIEQGDEGEKRCVTRSTSPTEESQGKSHSSPVPILPVYTGYYYPSYHSYPPYPSYPLYTQWWGGSHPLHCQYPSYPSVEHRKSQELEEKKPKKITDFSIDTIMNR